ncbi:hypothetical protein F5Y13DRAFT_195149 [Hypoxylon sp. FL1857]|nr:hypothetical protein F5Y13DRAFT_195149 [Hypoxylon sp. FL1857]
MSTPVWRRARYLSRNPKNKNPRINEAAAPRWKRVYQHSLTQMMSLCLTSCLVTFGLMAAAPGPMLVLVNATSDHIPEDAILEAQEAQQEKKVEELESRRIACSRANAIEKWQSAGSSDIHEDSASKYMSS